MSFSMKFEPVLHAMVEPNLKLIVTCGAMRESMVTNYIEIQFDPQMDPNGLIVEKSNEEKSIWLRFNSTPPPPDLRNWPAFQSITKIMIVEQIKGNTLAVMIPDSGDGFRRDASLLKRYCGDAIDGFEYEILQAAILAALSLPQFDRDAAQEGVGEVGRVAIYLEPSLGRELARHTGRDLGTHAGEFVLLADRSVRS